MARASWTMALSIAWELLAGLPMNELKRVREFIPTYHPNANEPSIGG